MCGETLLINAPQEAMKTAVFREQYSVFFKKLGREVKEAANKPRSS